VEARKTTSRRTRSGITTDAGDFLAEVFSAEAADYWATIELA
jgi:hypothetical protein